MSTASPWMSTAFAYMSTASPWMSTASMGRFHSRNRARLIRGVLGRSLSTRGEQTRYAVSEGVSVGRGDSGVSD